MPPFSSSPGINRRKQEITAPTECPECQTPIVAFTEERSKITTHWCEKVECLGCIRDMLTFVADRTLLEIEGLGPEMADVLAKGGYVVNLADLFEFCNDAREAINRIGHERFSEAMRAPLEKRYRAFRPATRSTPRQGRGQTFE